MAATGKKCIGFGPYEGICKNTAGTKWTPHWCLRCDELRRERISKALVALIRGA